MGDFVAGGCGIFLRLMLSAIDLPVENSHLNAERQAVRSLSLLSLLLEAADPVEPH